MRLPFAPISREARAARLARCAGCHLTINGKGHDADKPRFCGPIFNTDRNDRHQEAYLPVRAANGNATCHLKLWDVDLPPGYRPREPEKIPDGWDSADFAKDSRGTDGCSCA